MVATRGWAALPIAYCKRCQRIFNKLRRDICFACVEEQERAFQVVRGYLKDHKDASLMEVSEETEVDPEDIIELIREGLLMVRDNPNLSYACERCGQPTQAGRYCASCSAELTAALHSAGENLTKKAASAKDNRPRFFSR